MSYWQYYGFPDPTFVSSTLAMEGLFKALMERRSVFCTHENNKEPRYRTHELSQISVDVSFDDIMHTEYVEPLSETMMGNARLHSRLYYAADYDLMYKFDYWLSILAQYYYNEDKGGFWDFFSLCRDTAVYGDVVFGDYNPFTTFSQANHIRYCNIFKFWPEFPVQWLKHRYRMLNKLNCIRFINGDGIQEIPRIMVSNSYSSLIDENVGADNDFWSSFQPPGDYTHPERIGSTILTDYRGGSTMYINSAHMLDTLKPQLSWITDRTSGHSYYPIERTGASWEFCKNNDANSFHTGINPLALTNEDFLTHYNIVRPYIWRSGGQYAPYKDYGTFNDFGYGFTDGEEGVWTMNAKGEAYHRTGSLPSGSLSLEGYFEGFSVEISKIEMVKQFNFHFKD